MSTSTSIHSKAGPACDQRVWATPRAIDAIARLRAEMGRLILRHPAGREGEVEARIATMPTHASRTDFCVGVAGGVPFYVDREEDASLGYPDFELFVRTERRPGRRGGPAQCERLMSRALRRGERGR
jgi:uncharacterized protein (DUF779 family)